MSFNPDPSEQAQEVTFSRKHKIKIHPSNHFNNSPIRQASFQENHGTILNTILDFQEYIKSILSKVKKTIAILRKLQNIFPRASSLKIFKSFVSRHLDYGDIIYDQCYNNNFHQKMQSTQYKA